MRTKNLLQTIGSIIFIILLATSLTRAQIPVQGLVSDNEGVASWDADGSGPEPQAYGHQLPFTWGSSFYYTASLDYIGYNQNAAMAHFLDNISGFPLFVQALSDNGYTAAQVKIKYGLTKQLDDIEGEDWFTIDSIHYFNRYDGSITIELNGEPMIYAYVNFNNIRDKPDIGWATETNFTTPFDISEESSMEVQEVAGAFMADMDGEELRLTTVALSESPFDENGRHGFTFNIMSGYLEKGLPELLYEGYGADHEGIAVWNADGTGPEPQRTGHSYTWDGSTYTTCYYAASRDYDDIDTDPNACLAHFTQVVKGFPNFEIQLAYRGYTIDQFKTRVDLSTMGNDIEGEDWGIDTVHGIHWFNYYGGNVTLEIAGEPILLTSKDTTFLYQTLDTSNNWEQYTTNIPCEDISANASDDAKQVASSFIKDLGSHNIMYALQGNSCGSIYQNTDGRSGGFENMWGSIITRLPDSLITVIAEPWKENPSKIDVNIFPNPVSSNSIIEFHLENKAHVQLSIVDICGRNIYTSEFSDMHTGTNKITFNAEILPAGIYLCRLKIGNETLTKKVIKF